jgi:hypothetical protein
MANLHSNPVRGEICARQGLGLAIHHRGAASKMGVNLLLAVGMVELIGGFTDGGPRSKGLYPAQLVTPHCRKPLVSKDPKTYLQEWSLARGSPSGL